MTNAVVASWVVLVPTAAVGAVGVPVKAGDCSVAPPAADTSLAINVTAPVRPLNVVTPASTELIMLITKSVVAICVVLVLTAAVGAVGTPVKAGELIGAKPVPEFAMTNAVVANWVVEVPGAAVGAAGVPVKVGLARSAPPAAVRSAAPKTTMPVRPLKLTTPVVLSATAFIT